MALTFPLSTAAFADKLRIETVKWSLQHQQEYTGLGSGEILTADLGPALWAAEVRLVTMYNDDAAEVQALIEALDGSLNPFFLYSPQKAFPRRDPDGGLLGAATPKIGAIGSNNKSMTITGLPAGYVSSAGDYLHFDYGTNPTRRAYHRIVETVAASSGGTTPLFEVRPHIRPGAAAGLAVVLIKPAPKVVMVPGSFDPGDSTKLVTTGMSFQVRQTL